MSGAFTAPADGNYRIYFVAGSYDRTGGTALGAKLYAKSFLKRDVVVPGSSSCITPYIYNPGTTSSERVQGPFPRASLASHISYSAHPLFRISSLSVAADAPRHRWNASGRSPQ